jgi:hypothetical protein
MKAYDIETKSYHRVVSLDYDNNVVVMESPEYGRTRNTIDKVRLIQDLDEDMKGKTIIKPELFWMIPFVGWFMIPYKLFTIDDCVIQSKSIKDQIVMIVSSFGPIFLFLFLMMISTIK